MNEVTQNLIATFAKNNRVSKVKITSFVEQVLAANVVKKMTNKEKTATRLAAIQEAVGTDKFMVKDLTMIKNAWNTVTKLEKMGLVTRVGFAESTKRGRKEVLFQL